MRRKEPVRKEPIYLTRLFTTGDSCHYFEGTQEQAAAAVAHARGQGVWMQFDGVLVDPFTITVIGITMDRANGVNVISSNRSLPLMTPVSRNR